MASGESNILSQLRRTLRVDRFECAPDEQLLEQFVTLHDEAAFAVLVRRHGPMVWGVCQRLLLHRQDTEDAFQVTFLILARKAAAISQRKLLANWLFGVARRVAWKLRAVQTRRARHEQLRAEPPDIPMPLALPDAELRVLLDEELTRLPVKYRLPLLLCGLEGLSHTEAAQRLGWPIGTVAGRLSQGRELLRARLVRRGILVSAAVLTGVLRPAPAIGSVPPSLVTAAVRNAASLVCGKSTAVALSPCLTTLMRSVLLKLFLSQICTASALLAAFTLSLAGAGILWPFLRRVEVPYPAGFAEQPRSSAGSAQLPASPPGANPVSASPPAEGAFRLPDDANAVVLEMDRFVDSAPGLNVAMAIYADGRVVAEAPEGVDSLLPTGLTQYAKARASVPDPGSSPQAQRVKLLEGKISTAELHELVRFALQEQQFLAIDSGAVRAAIRETYQSDAQVTDSQDATTTRFRIQTAECSHEVKWFRLTKAAWDFPKVERLSQLHALDQRLSQVFSVLRAGGPERVDAVVAKMQELILPYYRLYPDLPRLTAADLLLVAPAPDGSGLTFTFSRNKDRLIRNPLFEVSLRVPPHGEPTLCYVIPPGQRFRGRVTDSLGFLPLLLS